MANLYEYNGSTWVEIAKNGTNGADGAAATIAVGTTTTLDPGSDATVSNSGTSSAAVFDFGIPSGLTGETGPIGETGPAGPSNVLSIGTVTSGASPAVTITGTSPSQTLNFVLEQGPTGATGATGAPGPNTVTTSTTTTITGFLYGNGSTVAAGHVADSTHDGYLSSSDWSTFNSKQAAGSYLTTVTADAPLTGSGTSASHLSIPAASSSANGYLSSSDWSTFNSKQPSVGATSGILKAVGSGNISAATNGTDYLKQSATGTSATYGTAGTLPGTPAGFITVNIGGTNYKVPYYNI